MQLIALVEGPTHVCCRYRLEAFRPWLETAGHSLVLIPLPRTWPKRWLLFRRLRGATVLLQRQLLPGWQLAQLRQSVAHLLFDFDDAVFLRDSYSPREMHHPRRLRRFIATVRASDAVIAGNTFLAEHAELYTAAERIHVIPTCVDETRYLCESVGSGDGKELVWIGSSSTLQGLERTAPLLDALSLAVPGLRLKVICDRFPKFEHLPVVPCRWSEAREAEELAASDIGISWVPDDLWSRGKCGLKLLQYMAAGLPTIANPVGVQTELVREGETGYLASTPSEWCAAVRQLVGAAEERRRLGRAGRRRVEAEYSVNLGASGLLQVLDRLERSAAVRTT